ncbi:RagB/SusD family nutrient uptake outer membrane protein [Gangjinia marincola]|uniref:RagB/SusD family nutrient uptake outer membrane protein n=1 Tax=Gangjinia marincola TaxID=578463 RepID=A0ABN1MJ33_9FLAO
MKKTKWINKHYIYALCMCVITFVSCTDLEIEETDSIITEEGIFTGLADVSNSLDGLYSDIYSQLETQESLFALNEVTSDALIVPTRGTDWGDNGVWRQLHAHNWSSTHLFIFNTWNNLNQNVLRATEIIDPLSEGSAQEVAEARFLRAFNMYFVLDLWGIAPFRNPTDGNDVLPSVFSTQEAYDFILNDLQEALPDLPNNGPGANPTKASKAAANFLLAKIYLNANRYKGTSDFSTEDMQNVVDAVDAIEDAGYGLQSGYFELFGPENDVETVWAVSTGIGPRVWNTLHYNQNDPRDGENNGGGWNGFSTLAEFYDSFDGDSETNFPGDAEDERRGFVPVTEEDNDFGNKDLFGIGLGFLVGQQYDGDGSALTDRNGNPLVFTRDFPGLIGNNERTGIRVIKYHPGISGTSFFPYQIMFRYADAHLMKAEAMLRMGSDITGMVNELRSLRQADDLDNVDLDELLAERGRELYIEYWRRNDLVRFGKFTDDWEFKDPASVGDPNRNLFPIPSNALVTNPNLTQNPGY